MYLDNTMSASTSAYGDSRRASSDIDRNESSATIVAEDSRRSSKDINRVDLEKGSQTEHLSMRHRIKHFTWAWYTTTMATGGLALLISATPHRFDGLTEIGAVIFVIDLILFFGITATLLTRFILFPGLLKKTLLHRRESLLFATFWLSIATIINNAQIYIAPRVGDDSLSS